MPAMRRVVEALGVLAFVEGSVPPAEVLGTSPELAKEFEEWTKKYDKGYAGLSETRTRFNTWLVNREFVNTHNEEADQGQHSYWVSLNKFGDMSRDEYRRKMLGFRKSNTTGFRSRMPEFEEQVGVEQLPSSKDWRQKNIIPNIKDQGGCGSCWAFSAVVAIEGAYNLKANGKVSHLCKSKCGPAKKPCCSFSEQELVDCTQKGAYTCDDGGDEGDGVEEISDNMKGVIDTEQSYCINISNHIDAIPVHWRVQGSLPCEDARTRCSDRHLRVHGH
eukprot:TRINITY_DN10488_c1_g1_i4.p1 TRINITY_DN10488_c1_g1~~TRINITY_DN10488_c1_g1_i4.p1  ORF type:complete len:275 (+),score=61.63 TRINITY_DN10488_c1_g1_i4:89-913(+)